MVQAYFAAVGVNLAPPKTVFFNDRLGELLVRATLQDLDIIQQAIEMLNQTPPQVDVEAKFADLTQEDSRGLGFNWYLGNTLMNNGAIGLQGGTAPSYQGPSTTANPSGIFPGGGTSIPGTSTFLPGPGAVDGVRHGWQYDLGPAQCGWVGPQPGFPPWAPSRAL